jgi:hypothetical protein
MKVLRLKPKKPPVVNPIREMGTKTWSAADDTFKDINSRRQAMKASFAKYWDEPARAERKKISPSVATGVGAAALGATAGVGGALLLRGKGTNTAKVVVRAAKTKAPKDKATAPAQAGKAPTQTVLLAPKGMTPPTLANEAEWVDHLHGLAAYLRTAQRKNAKGATHRVRAVIAAFLKADAALKD